MSVLESVLSSGKLRIAVMFTKCPEEGLSEEYYIDPKTGKPAGAVIEYMELMAKDLGVKPVYIDMHWSLQADALRNGEVDILPKHTNLPSRALLMDFALATINFDVVTVISKNAPQTMESLNADGMKIVCTKGSSNLEIVKRVYPKASVIEIMEFTDGIRLLQSGKAQGWVESPIAKTLFHCAPDLDVIRDENGKLIKLSAEFAHPAVARGEEDFLKWIINWQQYRTATGDLPKIYEKWKKCLVE